MDDWNAQYRRLPDWQAVRAHRVESGIAVPPGATFASLDRKQTSHRGIGRHRTLTTLFAAGVDQDYLDEICELEALEYLWLRYPVTARDLSGLARLKRLQFLKLDSPRNVADPSPLTALPALSYLFIENARHLADFEWLAPLRTRLRSLGVEGSMDTKQKLAGLAPLEGFTFEALFLTAVQLGDKDLTVLATCPNLKYLDCARFAPRQRFDDLRTLRPDIICNWFDRYEIKVGR